MDTWRGVNQNSQRLLALVWPAEPRRAYVVPVATDPDYRRMGLGKAAVLECVRRCAERGATVANVGSGQPFYEAIGFRKSWAAYMWKKTF